MTLKNKAIELFYTIEQILVSLKETEELEKNLQFRLVTRIEKDLNSYEEAIFRKNCKCAAKDSVASLHEAMDYLIRFLGKTESDIVSDDILNNYDELHTIFRESRYRDDNLY